MRRSLPLGVLILLAHAAPCRAACPAEAAETARIASVDAGLELRLTDGRRLRAVGLDPAQRTPDAPDRDDTTRARVAERVAGREVKINVLGATPDRWNRLPALVFLADAPPQPGGLAAILIAAGDGRYLAESASAACRDVLAKEAEARRGRLGLWADPYYSVLAVDDHDAFAERSGTIVLAEGRLTSVQTSPYRTTLHFAAPDGDRSGRVSHGGRMLVATILPRTMKAFAARQVDLQGLVGRTLRLRGLLNLRFGPQIEIFGPDALDVVAAPGAVPPAPAN